MNQKVKKVYSPITNREAILFDTISVNQIVEKYRDINLDVSDFFNDINEIYIYECLDTKYKFYFPYILGDEAFYERLQEMSGYYDPWKWENETANAHIKENSKVLDIGCGDGNFLALIRDKKGCSVNGLEFNEKSVRKCRAKCIDVEKTTIHDFAKQNVEKFDVVSCFQVLEHIAEVREFIDSALCCLKPNGKLILGVPNNKPFIFYQDRLHTLNLPPHHLGLWNPSSLSRLTKAFEIEVIKIEEEPGERYVFHYRTNLLTFLADNSNHRLLKIFYRGLNRMSYLPVIRSAYWYTFKSFSSRLVGHTVVGVYQKKGKRDESTN